MPSKTFKASGPAGVIMIGDYGINDAAVTNPSSYLSQLNFHSDLTYMRIVGTVSNSSCAFPAMTRNVVTWDDGSKGCGGLC
jgi:hypothetical protein